ncbi:hypothetical protein GSI_06780 [Ganoderma sinense ZZ0214-1]|uniref:Alginate lyase domain-containing protein n=1 Tax=Ganoderma sinense ZZ0214-1 TaxID=1077348 RepID=A0A2G8SE74_9APHY|nr:hypothetical protein GSI_06780 [Ganoderma sinense ZZ0214-1]
MLPAGIALRNLLLATVAGLVVADGNDWVNINYVLSQSNAANTADARQAILRKASEYARSGPWSVTQKKDTLPPSSDERDYLSWAPYHWPACNWCSHGTNHLSGPNQGGNSNSTTDPDPDPGTNDGSGDPYEGDDGYASDDGDDGDAWERRAFQRHRRMMTLRRNLLSSRLSHFPRQVPVDDVDTPSLPQDGPSPLPTSPPVVGDVPTLPTTGSSSVKTINGTPAPAQAPAKTEKNKCTPSPTKSLVPSATWTTCLYEVHDGKVNPDVRSLPDSPAMVTMSQAVLHNAIAYAMMKTRSYSQNAAQFIDTFFLASSTAMNPNLNFGQLVRGPGKEHQMGTFTGVLDLRGIVKITNAIALLKAARSLDWTSARDKAMTDWMRSYVSWLESSAIGKETASKANNHVSFYVNQLAAAKMYIGDTQGAQAALQNYFMHQFRDQIAVSGEQPFEAVRTRPFHYRCFNLEAMITNAKLGDQLGMDFWTAKSKYGATMQTALDHLITIDPKNEDITDIFPHVAAIAAAYGDPQGKYLGFLRSKAQGYTTQAFWFYDQGAALSHSPASQSKRRRDQDIGSDSIESNETSTWDLTRVAMEADNTANFLFQCPEVFDAANEVELEDGLFVTCEDLKRYYEQYPQHVDSA